MSEKSICRRCGYAGADDARYCARCGRALVPLRARTSNTARIWLDSLSPPYVGLLGLFAFIPISLLADYLLVESGLYFVLSQVMLALVIGLGSGYLGWLWDKPLSNRDQFKRMLFVLFGMAILLVAVRMMDRALLSAFTDSGRTVVSDIPGVHLEATSDHRRTRISNAPPYWLVAIAYALLAAIVGNLIHKVYHTQIAREKEVRDLRESLLSRVQDAAVQQERNRLARELHDSIKQQIFSISMSAAATEARWDDDPQGARQALGDVRRSGQEAMVEMNALLQQLSPVPLEKVGLVQALRDQCEALGYRTDAEVGIEFGPLPSDERLPSGAQESIFRIAQEAFSNVARHARAGHVRLYLGQRDVAGPLVLEIQDDGQGFEVDEIEGGMGLENIRQRVRALGGKLAIESAPGEGATLCITIPSGEAIIFGDDLPMYRQNHTLNKTFLAGLVGGLVLIATLFYPLYALVPRRSVAGWLVGSGALGLVLEVVAVFIAVGVGWLAARWAKAGDRQGGALFGALAGGVAGTVLYFGIGAAAASVVGIDLLLRHGLVPAAGDADLMRLLAESVVRVVWWLHGTFWAALMTGAGLGAIGGLLAPPSAEPSGRLNLRLAAIQILATGTMFSALTFVVAVNAFSLLEPAIRDGIVEYGLVLETGLVVEGISFWSISTPMAFYLAALVALYFPLRAEIETRDPARLNLAQVLAATFALVSFGLPALVLIVDPALLRPTSVLGVAVVATIASSLVLGGLYAVLSINAWRQRRAFGTERPRSAQVTGIVGALLSLIVITWAVSLPNFWCILIGLVIIVTDIALILVLRRNPGPPLSNPNTLAWLRLTMAQSISGGVGAVVAMIVPAMTTVSVIIITIVIATRFVPVLASYNPSGQVALDSALDAIVHDIYLAQARVFLIALVGAVVGVGLPTLAISGIMTLVKTLIKRRST
ncbi:MAG: sensor histidine kinase [Chloroflexota bacterium]|nr:sensor histidine kinase [Chloroflexota bacterium]